MSRHARPTAVSRAVCSLTSAGRPGLSATLVAALVVGAAPAGLLLSTAPASAQEAGPGAGPAASASPSPTATPTGDPAGGATPTASPASSPAASSPATSTPAPTAAPGPGGTPTPTPAPTATATPAEPEPDTGPVAPVLRMSTSTGVVRPGQAVTVGARMYRGPNSPADGVLLDVVGRRVGGGWARVAQVRTAANGLGTVRLTPRTTTEYQVRSAADERSTAASTDVRRVEVQPLLSGALTREVVPVGQASVLTGTLAPAYLGAVVRIDRNLGGRWQPVSAVRTGAGGVYRWSVAPGMTGSYAFRAVLPGTDQHRTAVSPTSTLVVDSRTLGPGSRGGDVRLLQQRLAAFGADVGRIDGVYGNDLRHAVTAFQKSQGLPRTGRYDAATRTRLASPRPIALRHPRAGRSVEVDLTKQVLYLAEGGRVKRIVDISSGNDELYTVDGVTERAFTPVGRFRVERKIDGVRVSRLGELYRPAYFVRGWAVHGSPSVPTYPASHGCIRVTNAAMDRLYDLLTVGTPLAVYRS